MRGGGKQSIWRAALLARLMVRSACSGRTAYGLTSSPRHGTGSKDQSIGGISIGKAYYCAGLQCLRRRVMPLVKNIGMWEKI